MKWPWWLCWCVMLVGCASPQPAAVPSDAELIAGFDAALESETQQVGILTEIRDSIRELAAEIRENRQQPPVFPQVEPEANDLAETDGQPDVLPVSVSVDESTASADVVDSDAATDDRPQPSAESSESVAGVWPDNVRIVFWTGVPCTNCDQMAPVLEQLKADGLKVRKIVAWHQDESGRTIRTADSVKYNVQQVPQTWLVRDDMTEHKMIGRKTVDEVRIQLNRLLQVQADDPQTITDMPVSVSAPLPTAAGSTASSVVRFDRESEIRHLLTADGHRGRFGKSYLRSLTDMQLIDLHNREHGVVTVNGVATSGYTVRYVQR